MGSISVSSIFYFLCSAATDGLHRNGYGTVRFEEAEIRLISSGCSELQWRECDVQFMSNVPFSKDRVGGGRNRYVQLAVATVHPAEQSEGERNTGSLFIRPVQFNSQVANFTHFFSLTNFFNLYVSSKAKSAPAADTTLSTFVDPFNPKGRPGMVKEQR